MLAAGNRALLAYRVVPERAPGPVRSPSPAAPAGTWSACWRNRRPGDVLAGVGVRGLDAALGTAADRPRRGGGPLARRARGRSEGAPRTARRQGREGAGEEGEEGCRERRPPRGRREEGDRQEGRREEATARAPHRLVARGRGPLTWSTGASSSCTASPSRRSRPAATSCAARSPIPELPVGRRHVAPRSTVSSPRYVHAARPDPLDVPAGDVGGRLRRPPPADRAQAPHAALGARPGGPPPAQDPPRPWLALVVIAEGEGALSPEPAPVAECVTPGIAAARPGPTSTARPAYYLTVTRDGGRQGLPDGRGPPAARTRAGGRRQRHRARATATTTACSPSCWRTGCRSPCPHHRTPAGAVGAGEVPRLPRQPRGPGRRAADRRRPRDRRSTSCRRSPTAGSPCIGRAAQRPRRHGHGVAVRRRPRRWRRRRRSRRRRPPPAATARAPSTAAHPRGPQPRAAERLGRDRWRRHRRRASPSARRWRWASLAQFEALRPRDDVPLPGARPLVVHRRPTRATSTRCAGARRRPHRHRGRDRVRPRPRKRHDHPGRAREHAAARRSAAARPPEVAETGHVGLPQTTRRGSATSRLVPRAVRAVADACGTRSTTPMAHVSDELRDRHAERAGGRQPRGRVRDRAAAGALAAGARPSPDRMAGRAVRCRAGRGRSARRLAGHAFPIDVEHARRGPRPAGRDGADRARRRASRRRRSARGGPSPIPVGPIGLRGSLDQVVATGLGLDLDASPRGRSPSGWRRPWRPPR